MKIIWFDIGHAAQLNFYKNSIKSLSDNHKILVTILKRGRLQRIAENEIGNLPNVFLFIVGKHNNTKLSAIIHGNLLRLISMLGFMLNNKIDLHISNGYQGSFISYFFRVPSITFGDDPRSFDYRMKLLFARKVFFCLVSEKYIKLNKKASILNCLKEWSYLNPKQFVPNEDALEKYNLKPHSYIFIREVTTGTLNYSYQKFGIIESISHLIANNISVLFSLEDKSVRHLYPSHWKLLQEPVDDIHSLIYYSRGLISSGDSMAREAAILGLPSLYIGTREMAANNVLIDMVDFFQVTKESFKSTYDEHFNEFSKKKQEENYKLLQNEFIDINEFIVETAKQFLNK